MDSLYNRVIGPDNDIGIADFIAVLSEYAADATGYDRRKLINIWDHIPVNQRANLESPRGLPLGPKATRQLDKLLSLIDAESTTTDKHRLILEWERVFNLAQTGRDYRTRREFEERLGL